MGHTSTLDRDQESATRQVIRMFGMDYTARHRRMLTAVAQGRAELTCSRHPGLSVDGRWCDQAAAGELVREGLVRTAGIGSVDMLVPVELAAAPTVRRPARWRLGPGDPVRDAVGP